MPGETDTIEENSEPEIETVQRSGTVLLVEDEEMVMNVGRAFLDKLGYGILEAKTG